MRKLCLVTFFVMAAATSYAGPPATTSPAKASVSPAVSALDAVPYFRFENFTTANGLPDNHVFTVLVDGDRVWAGTENGLALYENNAWKTYTTADGLAHRAV